MPDAFSSVEAAINEVVKARELLNKKKSAQVRADDEIDRLKSVAYAWFQTHRPAISAHASHPDTIEADTAYRTVMDSTGRHATRATYAMALQNAKQALVALRSSIALSSSTSTGGSAAPESLPNFAPLAPDPNMQAILVRRWQEVQQCIGSKANLAATVMMGGLLESLLLARINVSTNTTAVFSCKKAPRDKAGKTEPLPRWRLVDMVEVAHELAWITKSAKDVGHVLRDFRNYIHPHKEFIDNLRILDEDAQMFWGVTKSITRHVLNSVGKSP